MKLPGDEIVRTYIDNDSTEVTVVKDNDGKEWHCWEMECSREIRQMIRNGAKQHGIEEWEYLNIVLREMLEKHAEEQTKRAFIEEISE